MALRLLEVHVAKDLADPARELLLEVFAEEAWTEEGGAYGAVVRAVIGSGRTGAALDLLHGRLSSRGALRVLVLPLDAVLPRPAAMGLAEERLERSSFAAVSREEIYASISDSALLTPAFLAMAALASIVAAIGLTKDNTAAVIGAMVVAPLLGPSMGLSLAIALGDDALLRRSIWTNLAGFGVAFATALAVGLFLEVDPSVPELASRTEVGLGDIALALAAGCAGTLAYTTGAPTYLVGVMVAVAILPPSVAGGLLLSHGFVREAAAAGLLVLVNVVSVLLAAMATLLLQGIRPRVWWREQRARSSARLGLIVLAALLTALAAAVLVADRFPVR